MSLKYTASLPEMSALGKLEASRKEKKGVKWYFRSQTENYKISVSISVCIYGFMYVSVYGFFFFSDNIVEVVNEF